MMTILRLSSRSWSRSTVIRRAYSPQEALFAALPLSFNRQQALEEAERNNIPTATLDTCLKRMQERGTLEKNGRGEYSFGGRVTHK